MTCIRCHLIIVHSADNEYATITAERHRSTKEVASAFAVKIATLLLPLTSRPLVHAHVATRISVEVCIRRGSDSKRTAIAAQ